MAAIDATARVADGARIGDGVEIGPYCLVGPQVELKDGVRLVGHVNVTGVTTIGEGTVVYPFASLGTPPQSVHYRGGATTLVIGARCELRESVTMNTGTEDGGGITRVGDRCLFMVASHVGHDCEVGDDVTFANNAVLGGHVSIGDNTFLGGNVGGSSIRARRRRRHGRRRERRARADVIPFGFAKGQIATLDRTQRRRPAAARRDARRIAPAAPGLSRAVLWRGRVRRSPRRRRRRIRRRSAGAENHCVHPRRRQAAVDASAPSSAQAEDDAGDAS